jgi:hypothetical protein
MPEVQMLARRILMVLPAIALVLLSGYIIKIWKLLPDDVASHFDGAGVPNGWSTKGSFVAIVLIVASGIDVAIYTMLFMHGNSVPIGILYFVCVFVSSIFWLSLRANIREAPLVAMKVLPGAICGLVCGIFAAWSMR